MSDVRNLMLFFGIGCIVLLLILVNSLMYFMGDSMVRGYPDYTRPAWVEFIRLSRIETEDMIPVFHHGAYSVYTNVIAGDSVEETIFTVEEGYEYYVVGYILLTDVTGVRMFLRCPQTLAYFHAGALNANEPCVVTLPQPFALQFESGQELQLRAENPTTSDAKIACIVFAYRREV